MVLEVVTEEGMEEDAPEGEAGTPPRMDQLGYPLKQRAVKCLIFQFVD